MSLPSDVNPDVAEAVDRLADAPGPGAPGRSKNNLTNEQIGLVAAALAAFLGITYFGPMITRLTRPKPFRARMAERTRTAKARAWRFGQDAGRAGRKANRRAAKQTKRLGGGRIWR